MFSSKIVYTWHAHLTRKQSRLHLRASDMQTLVYAHGGGQTLTRTQSAHAHSDAAIGRRWRSRRQVQGLGPSFKVKLSLQNTGRKVVTDLVAMLTYNPMLYRSATCARRVE
eukprot:6199865-Pleurochrysis_carterae.AAC.2